MHESHWGLHESPFRGLPDLKYFHESPTHDEALARLLFLVERRRRLSLLLGEHGSGKSLLLNVLDHHLRQRNCHTAKINLLGIDEHEFAWNLAARLGTDPPACECPLFALWRRIADQLVEDRYQSVATIVLLDDADQCSGEVLTCIERLVNLDPVPDSRLTVILAADSRHVERLGLRLLELAELRIELEAWEEADSTAYLKSCLAKAGREGGIFAPAALTRLHELGRGVPRHINQLADLSLLAGAARQLEQVDDLTVQTVYQELSAIHLP